MVAARTTSMSAIDVASSGVVAAGPALWMQFRRQAIAAWLLLALLLAGCDRADTERQIRDNVDRLQAAIENDDSDAVLDLLAVDFQGVETSDGSNATYGGYRAMDRQLVQRTLQLLFLRHQKITVAVSQLQVMSSPDDPLSASMAGTAILAGGKGLLPDSGRIVRFEGDWLLDDGDWRLTRLRWQ